MILICTGLAFLANFFGLKFLYGLFSGHSFGLFPTLENNHFQGLGYSVVNQDSVVNEFPEEFYDEYSDAESGNFHFFAFNPCEGKGNNSVRGLTE